jgi:hypothetical protein
MTLSLIIISSPKETLQTIVEFVGEHWEWWQAQVSQYKRTTGDKTRLSNWLDAAERAQNSRKILGSLADFIVLVDSDNLDWLNDGEQDTEAFLLEEARQHVKRGTFPTTFLPGTVSDGANQTPSLDNLIESERINVALGLAQNAFWKTFDTYFPEIGTDAFPEENACAFTQACKVAVNCWVTENFPEVVMLEDLKMAVINAGYKIVQSETGYFFEVESPGTVEEEDDTYGSTDELTEEGAYRAAYADLNMTQEQRKQARV